LIKKEKPIVLQSMMRYIGIAKAIKKKHLKKSQQNTKQVIKQVGNYKRLASYNKAILVIFQLKTVF
jgi:hypothetical protein